MEVETTLRPPITVIIFPFLRTVYIFYVNSCICVDFFMILTAKLRRYVSKQHLAV